MNSTLDWNDMRPLFLTVVVIVVTILLTLAAIWLHALLIERENVRHLREQDRELRRQRNQKPVPRKSS